MNSDPAVNLFCYFNLSPMYRYLHLLSRPPFILPTHCHDFWHLICVTDGELHISSDGKDFVVGTGYAYLQPAGIPHQLASRNGYTQLGINFLPSAKFQSQIPHPIAVSMPEMLSEVRRLLALDNHSLFYSELVVALCDLLVYGAADAACQTPESPLRQKIELALEDIPFDRFSIKALADSLYISPSHLERSCRALFGVSALQLFHRRQLERACTLLADERLSIREIGEALGFSEGSNFSAFFKKHAGVSPSAYRKRSFE